MLHPGREEDYVRFLEVRKTPIIPLARPEISVSDEEVRSATQKFRKLVKTDRALYDKAQKAFVSWVRSYGAHQATSIFRASDLDWADLAEAWGLLRMPRMPELKTWEGDKMLGEKIDWDTFAYKEKAREQARLEALEAERTGAADNKREDMKRKRKKNEAWSGKLEKEDVRVERREKRRKKREAERSANMTEDEKVKQMELEALIAQVRRQNQEKEQEKEKAASKDDEFEGFDD